MKAFFSVAILAVLFSSIQARAQPDLQIQGRIVFCSTRDGNHEIYIMSSDGSNLVRLTSNTTNDLQPAISPDGTQIAFTAERDGNREIYVMDTDGSNPVRLTNEPAEDSAPWWSPDGSRIVFQSRRDGDDEFYTIKPDGSDLVKITDNSSFNWTPRWSSDGAKIAFYSPDLDGGDRADIYTINADGSNLVQITSTGHSDGGAIWSPDGTRIAFHSNVGLDNTTEIQLIDPDGSNRISITDDSRDSGVAWSPDGTRLIYASAREDGNTPQLYTANSDGSNEQKLISSIAADYCPFWERFEHIGAAQVGTPILRIMTIENTGTSNLAVSNLVSSSGLFTISPTNFTIAPGGSQDVDIIFTPATEGTVYSTLTITSNDPDSPSTSLIINGTGEAAPDLRIDGKVAFMSDRDGNWEIYTMNADGSGLTRLTNNSAIDSGPVWSPDNNKIAFMSDRDGNREIYVMDADGANPIRLTNNVDSDTGPRWSPDGMRLFFIRIPLGENNQDIYSINVDGTGETRITNTPYNEEAPNWSPIGNQLVFRYLDQDLGTNSNIYLMSPDGTGRTQVTNNFTNEGLPAWSPDASRISFWRSDPTTELYTMDPDGNNVVKILNGNTGAQTTTSWSLDGGHIAFDMVPSVDEEIFVMKSDGSNVVNLTNNPGRDTTPSWQKQQHIGTVDAWKSVSATLRIANDGSGPLSVSDIQSSDSQFSASPTSFVVAPGGAQDISIQFSPTAVGTHYATLAITSNDPDTPTASFIVNGTGTDPIVSVSLPDTTSLYNQSISIPVRIGDTTNLDIVAAEVFVAYDGDLLTAFSAGTTGTLAANGWTVVENIVEGNGTNIDTIKVAMATDNAALAGAGALVHIDFQVADQRSPASSLLELVHVLFNDGDPDNAITNGSVVITGTDGSIDSSPATIIPREAIAVTVTDIDEDQDINSPDSFSIAVANGAQSEMLTLTETGNSTGVFTGSINTVFSFGASSGDGTVQAKAGDQIVFTYADLLDAAGATALRTVQTDAIGGADGSVAVTLVSQPGDPLYIEVTDGDLNAVISSAETVAVSVSNSRTAEVFSVVLTEVDADDAVFFGMLSTHSTASTAAEMETAEDDIITVSYDDVVTAVGDQQDRTATNDVIEPWGDADDNDALQAFDAAQVLLHVLNSGHAIDVQAANVDIDPVVTGITPFDASLILQKRVGLIASFPVQSAASTNHPQGAPASKRIAEQRSLALVMDEGYLSVVADERGGLLSGDLTLRGIVGRVEMAPELAAYLSASRPVEDGQRIVFAGAEAASGPGELLRVYTAAASRVELTSAAFNDGAIEGIGSGLNVESTPRAYALHANMPNPFNPETAIGFSLPQAGRVELVVYDALGQRVRELVSSHWSAGVHSAMWDGRSDSGAQVSSGVYFYRLRAGDFAQTRRMLLLK